MGEAIAGVLPYALGVAASPLPIIAVILVLFSARARVAGPAFLAGALAGVIAISAAVYVLGSYGYLPGDQQASTAAEWVRLALGALLLFAAFRHFVRHRRANGSSVMPKWMASVDRWSPVKASVLALLMYGVDPKNLALCAGAARGLVDSSTLVSMLALLVFSLVACLPVVVMVGLFLAGGDRATVHLTRCRTWLSSHHLLVMAGLLLVFGVLLAGNAVRDLLVH